MSDVAGGPPGTDPERAGRLLYLIICLSMTTIGALLFTLLLVFI